MESSMTQMIHEFEVERHNLTTITKVQVDEVKSLAKRLKDSLQNKAFELKYIRVSYLVYI